MHSHVIIYAWFIKYILSQTHTLTKVNDTRQKRGKFEVKLRSMQIKKKEKRKETPTLVMESMCSCRWRPRSTELRPTKLQKQQRCSAQPAATEVDGGLRWCCRKCEVSRCPWSLWNGHLVHMYSRSGTSRSLDCSSISIYKIGESSLQRMLLEKVWGQCLSRGT